MSLLLFGAQSFNVTRTLSRYFCRPPAACGCHFCGFSQVLFADMKPSLLPPSPNMGKYGDQNEIRVEHSRGRGGLQALTNVDRVLNVKGADEMSNANTFEFSTEDRSPFLLQPSKILSHLPRSPAQVGCMRWVLGAGALGRPRGIGWRGRWEGGSGWGITCKSMADSCQCMAKNTTIL